MVLVSKTWILFIKSTLVDHQDGDELQFIRSESLATVFENTISIDELGFFFADLFNYTSISDHNKYQSV